MRHSVPPAPSSSNVNRVVNDVRSSAISGIEMDVASVAIAIGETSAVPVKTPARSVDRFGIIVPTVVLDGRRTMSICTSM